MNASMRGGSVVVSQSSAYMVEKYLMARGDGSVIMVGVHTHSCFMLHGGGTKVQCPKQILEALVGVRTEVPRHPNLLERWA